MGIGRHHEDFVGRRVVDWPRAPITDPGAEAYRLSWGYEHQGEAPIPESVPEQLLALLADPRANEVQALLIGVWSEEMFDDGAAETAQALVEAAPGLSAVEALFFGDVTYEECEISWIIQSDMSPLVMAFPKLRVFGVRGGQGLGFGGLRHEALEELVVQTGGLSGECVRELGVASLPALRRLELWLGTARYGGSVGVADLEPILSGKLFPRLSHLGLCNYDEADAVAVALASAPVVEGLQSLDLSMGTLTDAGAEALLSSPAVRALQRLDLGESYLTAEATQRLTEAMGDRCVLWGQRQPSRKDRRYVMHGE